MRSPNRLLGDFVLLVGTLMMLAAAPARAQPAAAAANPADQLVGLDTIPDLNIAALRQQAAERVRSKALPAAPWRGSQAPNTSRARRACTMAAAHIGHGSSVT